MLFRSLSLHGGKRTEAVLRYRDSNVYEADMPSSWIEEAGSYSLWVNSTGEAVRLDFKVSKTHTKLYIGLGIIGMLVVTALVAVCLLGEALSPIKCADGWVDGSCKMIFELHLSFKTVHLKINLEC